MDSKGCVLFTYARAIHIPIPCETTVARAAPSIPHLNTSMKSKSNAMFRTFVIRMNSIGRTDSPTPRKIEMMLLKVTNRNVPPM